MFAAIRIFDLILDLIRICYFDRTLLLNIYLLACVYSDFLLQNYLIPRSLILLLGGFG